MATISTSLSFLALPGEIRNTIYRYHFSSVHNAHFSTQHCFCNRDLSSSSECNSTAWKEYAHIFFVSKQTYEESRSLFEREFVPKHKFYFHDISELRELWDRTGWRGLRGCLEYDVRMAITGGCVLAGEGKRTWGERGRDNINAVMTMVARDAGYEDVDLFRTHMTWELGQKREVGRCGGNPVLIRCGNGEVIKFWFSSGSLWKELPMMFMEGNLGSLPFLQEMLAL